MSAAIFSLWTPIHEKEELLHTQNKKGPAACADGPRMAAFLYPYVLPLPRTFHLLLERASTLLHTKVKRENTLHQACDNPFPRVTVQPSAVSFALLRDEAWSFVTAC
jgi:hypothetical protein